MNNNLETLIKEYIKEQTRSSVNLKVPLAKIAEDINSSTASVWRAIQKLENKRVIKVVKPKQKTEPNAIYYLGEENELNDLLDDLMIKTSSLLIIMREIKSKIKQRDDKLFSLEQEIQKLKVN